MVILRLDVLVPRLSLRCCIPWSRSMGRWAQKAEELAWKFSNLIGDCLLTSAAVTYLGPFVGAYRDRAMEDWLGQLDGLGVPRSGDYSLVETLNDPVAQRSWLANYLPSDTFSIQNAVILTRSTVWPLLIDPQVRAAQIGDSRTSQ